MPIAVFIVDEQLTILQSNKNANIFTDSSSILNVSVNKLSTKSFRDNKKLLLLVGKIASTDNAYINQPPLVIDHPEIAENQIIIVGTPVKAEGLPGQSAVALFVSNRKSQPMPMPDTLVRLYNLSHKEAEITRYLIQGLSINKISEINHVSKHTVRNQVKSIFSKTGTARQAELVSLVLTGPGSLIYNTSENISQLNQDLSLSQNKFPRLQHINLDAVRTLSWQEYGDPLGLPVIYGHSSLGSSYEITPEQDKILKRKGLRLIAPDRPGRSLSSAAPEMTLSSWVNDFENILYHLNIKEFQYIGYEIGALFGAAYAALKKSGIKKLIIVSTGLMPESKIEWKKLSPFFRMNLKCALDYPQIHRMFNNMMVHGIKSNPKRLLNILGKQFTETEKQFDFTDQYLQNLTASITNTAALATMMTRECQLSTGPWEFELSDVDCEIEQWHGSEDSFIPLISAKRLASAFKSEVQTRYLANQGRFIFYTHFDEIINSLVD